MTCKNHLYNKNEMLNEITTSPEELVSSFLESDNSQNFFKNIDSQRWHQFAIPHLGSQTPNCSKKIYNDYLLDCYNSLVPIIGRFPTIDFIAGLLDPQIDVLDDSFQEAGLILAENKQKDPGKIWQLYQKNKTGTGRSLLLEVLAHSLSPDEFLPYLKEADQKEKKSRSRLLIQDLILRQGDLELLEQYFSQALTAYLANPLKNKTKMNDLAAIIKTANQKKIFLAPELLEKTIQSEVNNPFPFWFNLLNNSLASAKIPDSLVEKIKKNISQGTYFVQNEDFWFCFKQALAAQKIKPAEMTSEEIADTYLQAATFSELESAGESCGQALQEVESFLLAPENAKLLRAVQTSFFEKHRRRSESIDDYSENFLRLLFRDPDPKGAIEIIDKYLRGNRERVDQFLLRSVQWELYNKMFSSNNEKIEPSQQEFQKEILREKNYIFQYTYSSRDNFCYGEQIKMIQKINSFPLTKKMMIKKFSQISPPKNERPSLGEMATLIATCPNDFNPLIGNKIEIKNETEPHLIWEALVREPKAASFVLDYFLDSEKKKRPRNQEFDDFIRKGGADKLLKTKIEQLPVEIQQKLGELILNRLTNLRSGQRDLFYYSVRLLANTGDENIFRRLNEMTPTLIGKDFNPSEIRLALINIKKNLQEKRRQ